MEQSAQQQAFGHICRLFSQVSRPTERRARRRSCVFGARSRSSAMATRSFCVTSRTRSTRSSSGEVRENRAVPWTKPSDLGNDEFGVLAKLLKDRNEKCLVALADNTVRSLP